MAQLRRQKEKGWDLNSRLCSIPSLLTGRFTSFCMSAPYRLQSCLLTLRTAYSVSAKEFLSEDDGPQMSLVSLVAGGLDALLVQGALGGILSPWVWSFEHAKDMLLTTPQMEYRSIHIRRELQDIWINNEQSDSSFCQGTRLILNLREAAKTEPSISATSIFARLETNWFFKLLI